MSVYSFKSIGFWGRVFFAGAVILIGRLLWSMFGTSKLIPFLIIGIGFLFLEIRRQRLIDRAIKEISLKDNQELKEKILQLEAKRSLITTFFYLIKKMGLGKKSGLKFVNSHELADLGTNWIKEHLAKMMRLYEILNPFLLNSFLPPIKAVLCHNILNKKVFLGASIGCGLARFEEKIAKYCNKKKLPAVIFATDINKDLILKAKERMGKNGIMAGFQNVNHKIDIKKLVSYARNKQQSLVYLVPINVEDFPTLFQPDSKLDLVWFLQSREHTIEGRPETFDKIKKFTKEWAILETFRSWGVILWGNLISWWLSPLFATETEISIARNYTPKEWVEKKIGVVIKRYPYFGWILSGGAYKILKESKFLRGGTKSLSRLLGLKDKLIFHPGRKCQ